VANADELQIKMAQGKQAIKQVALARYSYVANADELQIKMAQGKQKNHLCGQR
jgi:glutamate synthase domain-containing protein 2